MSYILGTPSGLSLVLFLSLFDTARYLNPTFRLRHTVYLLRQLSYIMTQSYDLSFLQINNPSYNIKRRALIILNQPFSYPLLSLVWNATQIHFCADGGANRLYDLLDEQTRQR